MEQTPIHGQHNPDLLRMIPPHLDRVIEIGCSSGALAREYKKSNPNCWYVGVEIDPSYAELAKQYCDETIVLNLDDAPTDFFRNHSDKQCWVFGDTLEHLKDPWKALRSIHKVLPENGGIAACIPNAQHWSLIIKLLIGDFTYTDSGLLDRTHLRWFTKKTIIELFNQNGFVLEKLEPRIFEETSREQFLQPLIELTKSKFKIGNELLFASELSALQYVCYAKASTRV